MTANKPLFIVYFLIIFQGNALGEWDEYMREANGDAFFYNKGNIQQEDSLVKVWTRIRYKSSVMGAASYQSLIRIDCCDDSETTLQSTFYIDSNWTHPAMATDAKKKPKTYIDGNDALERLTRILCKH